MNTKKLTKRPEAAIELGTGVLSWPRGERVSDRYGLVNFSDEASIKRLKNEERGWLVAEIVEARESNHIGDIFRGLFPRIQATGDLIELGFGKLFYEDHGTCVGVQPNETQDSDWMNPRALYDIHNSLVRLLWVPETK